MCSQNDPQTPVIKIPRATSFHQLNTSQNYRVNVQQVKRYVKSCHKAEEGWGWGWGGGGVIKEGEASRSGGTGQHRESKPQHKKSIIIIIVVV